MSTENLDDNQARPYSDDQKILLFFCMGLIRLITAYKKFTAQEENGYNEQQFPPGQSFSQSLDGTQELPPIDNDKDKEISDWLQTQGGRLLKYFPQSISVQGKDTNSTITLQKRKETFFTRNSALCYSSKEINKSLTIILNAKDIEETSLASAAAQEANKIRGKKFLGSCRLNNSTTKQIEQLDMPNFGTAENTIIDSLAIEYNRRKEDHGGHKKSSLLEALRRVGFLGGYNISVIAAEKHETEKRTSTANNSPANQTSLGYASN